MKNTDARKILGLDPGDDPRSFIPTFEETVAYKKDLMENAPSPELRYRYEQELLEYTAAVKVVAGRKRLRPNTDFVVVLMLIGALSACGWWGYNWYQRQWNIDAELKQRTTYLSSLGRAAVSKRKWSEAESAYKEILTLEPGSSVAVEGMESIRLGKLEERNQQLFYSLGESQAALEAERWDEAERLALSVLKIDPENTTAKTKLELIAAGRHEHDVALKMEAVTAAVDAGKMAEARQAIAELRKIDPKNQQLPDFVRKVDRVSATIRANQAKALSLMEKAKKLDTGEFNAEAMAYLVEARKLDPSNSEISNLHSKMSAYTRAIKVPGDYATIAAALEGARPRDLIRISPGTYKESLEIHQPVRLEGSADGKTILQMPADQASLITIHPTAKGSLISGLTLVHEGFDHGGDRFSGITVMAQDVTLAACSVTHSAGHGIAVFDGAKATITSCEISECGWDGISVYGQDSQVTLRNTQSTNNIQHGLAFWQGGGGVVSKCKMTQNGLCGILAMSPAVQVTIAGSICSKNREAGILISDGAKALVQANRCDGNLLSGIVVRGEKTSADVTNNVAMGNQESGILTHLGVTIGKFEKNDARSNGSRQIWRDASLSSTSPQE
ncbi:right-handed parallel beta-helix repeat-containing protein [Verrucomicrobiaceae bacterium 5K15]|uniref:Right-handed parallel beta-helix repeat-containing protein n=1 Tax=Oceaniferula flava TaxID=2800421 RepID=A0AAE2SDI4_9BACT|nr:right-handed parallel beta-helix repeat-containing protein [Oceaniferula flavus]MBK1855769.1 right-handed parallel beta-helix repeat-containing protein [Oceaniferula flavus]MBM1137076.1 right-handed parallel beta-helix repeat-containing protein [Oceaniferula flavus]